MWNNLGFICRVRIVQFACMGAYSSTRILIDGQNVMVQWEKLFSVCAIMKYT